MTLKELLSTLNGVDIKVMIKDMDLNNICKINASAINQLNNELADRNVEKWSILRNNFISVYLENLENIVRVTGIEFDKYNLTLHVGETGEIIPTILPEDATVTAVAWEIDDETIAIVEDGIITPLKEGTVSIKATTLDGGYSATCVLIVDSAIIPVQGVNLSQEELELKIDSDDVQLIATVLPENASNKKVTWNSSNEDIVTVDNGLVHVVGLGNAVITVVTLESEYFATCSITVSEDEIPILEISLDNANIEMDLGGEDITLSPILIPENATGNIIWTSDDSTVVTVKNGVIHAEGVGNTIVTVMSELDNSIRAVCLVTVNDV